MKAIKEIVWKILLETNFNSEDSEEVSNELAAHLNQLSKLTGKDYQPLIKCFDKCYVDATPSEGVVKHKKHFWDDILFDSYLEL